MAYEPRDNSGSLFKETEKQSDRHPDYKGKAIIGGQAYYISGWKKPGTNGKKDFLSLAFELPRGASAASGADDDDGF